MKKYRIIIALSLGLGVIGVTYFTPTMEPTLNVAQLSKAEKKQFSELELDINQSILVQAKKCINKTPTRKHFQCPINVNTNSTRIDGKLEITRTGNTYDIETVNFDYFDKPSDQHTYVSTEDEGYYHINDNLQTFNYRVALQQSNEDWHSISTQPFTFNESSNNKIKIVNGAARNYGCKDTYFDWYSNRKGIIA
ncbi:hypothetical protein [Photobacterium leiognathi]|uniref:hypothetical protein n=1 Tax=Photobacterium leiognathi TaxID=553611 RepID=UPI002982B470|nr:hypothetical protein [Photobacterium leiognathi]